MALRTFFRTHTCGELRKSDVNTQVVLSGWIHNIRDLGGVKFLLLRDHYGLTQVVIPPNLESISKLPKESVVQVKGRVVLRPPENIDKSNPTGEIEVAAESITIISVSKEVLPFPLTHPTDVSEAIKLEYRFLQLRQKEMHDLVLFRFEFIKKIRELLSKRHFVEIHTPLLTGPSPEGARDFVVPSRRFKGKFYALPQAPQQFKQLLMISGFDRYFQIAPCFRDEDPRSDRSPGEFYQIDLEMAFVNQEDVLAEMEDFFKELTFSFKSRSTLKCFSRITFDEAIRYYGTDKPDLRSPFRFNPIFDPPGNLVEFFNGSQNLFFLGLSPETLPSRGKLDKVQEEWKRLFNSPLLYALKGSELKGTALKFCGEGFFESLCASSGLNKDSFVVFIGQRPSIDNRLEEFRVWLAKFFGCFDEEGFYFTYITDFYLYELDEQNKLQFCHNPFSMPQGGLEALLSLPPLKIKAYQYDLVLNGYEVSSGAIRNHELQTLLEAFKIVGYSEQRCFEEFPGIFKALQYGAPPHGGMAPGLERLLMIFTKSQNIRDVIPFPLSQSGRDLLMGAPRPLEEERLLELGLKISD